MPCYATGSAEGDAKLAMQEARNKATRATQQLCKLCRWLQDQGLYEKAPISVKRWYAEHEKIDKERLEQEEKERQRKLIKKAALAKLTPEERKVLGFL